MLEQGRMEAIMEQIKLREDYIKLGQALKAAGFAESGVDAKNEILDGKVKVNGSVEYQRGKKLYDGDMVEYKDNQIKIIK
jgi:ribosome-associated protein